MASLALIVGRDVPWVTAWTGEALLPAAPCASAGGALALMQQSAPGSGKPIYSQNHLVRQRLSIRHMLCPMCGAATLAGDRWTQIATPVRAGALRAANRGHALPADVADTRMVLDAGAIAPLHRACAERALRYCPHLKAAASTELTPFAAEWLVWPLLTRVEWPASLFLARPRSAAGGVAVAFLQLCGLF